MRAVWKISVLVVFVIILFTGCDNAFVMGELNSALSARVKSNQVMAEKLKTAGLISNEEYQLIYKSLDEKMGTYSKALSSGSGNIEDLTNAMVAFRTLPYEPYGKQAGYETASDWDAHIITNSIKGTLNNNILKGSGTVQPVSLIDEKMASEINERFGYPVYVLKGGTTGTDGIDEIYEVLQNATKNPDKVRFDVLDKFFVKAKDESGKDITLLDTSKRENRIVVQSDGVPESYVGKDNKVLKSQKSATSFPMSKYSNKCGKDMIVEQEGQPVFAIRFVEFNEDAVNKVIETLSLSEEKFMVCGDGTGGRVYLLEYPVHSVSSLKGTKDGFEFGFSESELIVNIKSGKMRKLVIGEEGLQEIKSKEPYLYLAGGKQGKESKSSFVLNGDADVLFKQDGEKEVKFKSGRLVLRDYLEVSYAPGVVSSEDLVVFGRKVRLKAFGGGKKTVVAKFLSGNTEDGVDLYMNDFMDVNVVLGGTLKVLAGEGETAGKVDASSSASGESSVSSEAVEGDSGDYSQNLMRIDGLSVERLGEGGEIVCSTAFGGELVGTEDTSGESQKFYGLGIRKNIFDTGLFSNWIKSSDSSNSLGWWNNWLGENGFNYKINSNSLEDYLVGNYKYELGDEGFLVLDLDVVSKLQKDIDIENKVKEHKKKRGLFNILGVCLVLYGNLLLLFHLLDTTLDFGVGLLKRCTFGRFVAVNSKDELKDLGLDKGNSKDGVLYLTFGELFGKVVSIIFVGILLIIGDFLQLSSLLFNVFGGVVSYLMS